MLSSLIIYLLKANLALLLFYLGYRYLLRPLTFYKLNRYYLLFSILFSASYPLIDIHQWLQDSPQIAQSLLTVAPNWQNISVPEEGIGINDLVNGLFWLSAAYFSILLLVKLFGIWRIHQQAIPATWSVYAFRKINKNISPFSFWKTVYLNPDNRENTELEKIFKHEYVHINQLHSLDILLAELSLLLFGYNPVCWLINNAIRDNIEFLTDQEVLQNGMDKKSYQYSLLQISTPLNQPQLANHFNLKNLKKRIAMMNKNQTSNSHLSKYVFILPALVLSLLAFNTSKVHDIRNKVLGEKIKNTPFDITQDTIQKTDPLYYVDGKVQPSDILNRLDQNQIVSIDVLKDKAAFELAGSKGAYGVIQITTKTGDLSKSLKSKAQLDQEKNVITVLGVKKTGDNTNKTIITLSNGQPSEDLSDKINDSVLIYIDGKKANKQQLQQIKPDDILEINVLKDEEALKTYGDDGKNAVIEIKLKK